MDSCWKATTGRVMPETSSRLVSARVYSLYHPTASSTTFHDTQRTTALDSIFSSRSKWMQNAPAYSSGSLVHT
jgi:hypothetical protein